MEKEIIKVSADSKPVAVKPEFKGYTLEELRYQRAMTLLRRDFSKAKVMNQVSRLRNGDNPDGLQRSRMGKVGNIAGKLMSGLNYIDYAMLGMSIFNSGHKLFKFFRRKR